jgi:hypothetical protein
MLKLGILAFLNAQIKVCKQRLVTVFGNYSIDYPYTIRTNANCFD